MTLITVEDIISFSCMRSQPLQPLWKLSERVTPPQLPIQFFWVLLTSSVLSPFSCFISAYPESKGKPLLQHGRGLFKLSHYCLPIMLEWWQHSLSIFNIVLHHFTVEERLQQGEVMAASVRP